MNHAIPEWRSRNQAPFWLMDFKKSVDAGSISSGQQFLPQPCNLGLAGHAPRFNVRAPGFVAARAGSRENNTTKPDTIVTKIRGEVVAKRSKQSVGAVMGL